MDKGFVLGFDTSNYKTSLAVIDNNNSVIYDERRFLQVKQGEKGLRQSDALFQHVKNIPDMISKMRESFTGSFDAIAYSSRPRPVEGSYMPVFLAGGSMAVSIGETLNVPVFGFSHQEGHIEAVKAYSPFKQDDHILACHFSGGTTELLDVRRKDRGYDIEIIGGTKDIAFGQVIDRAGVALGLGFPAGEEMDKMAMSATKSTSLLTPVKVTDGWFNLSGIDTQIKRIIGNGQDNYEPASLFRELFIKSAQAMAEMILQCSLKSGVNKVLMAGGVSSGIVIRDILLKKLAGEGIEIYFDKNNLSQDNAVGTAILGGNAIWR